MLETIYIHGDCQSSGVSNDSLTEEMKTILSRKEPNVDHHWHVDLEKWGQPSMPVAASKGGTVLFLYSDHAHRYRYLGTHNRGATGDVFAPGSR